MCLWIRYEISLKYFNKDFQEYVDLDDISAIESILKLNVFETISLANNLSGDTSTLHDSSNDDNISDESLNSD